MGKAPVRGPGALLAFLAPCGADMGCAAAPGIEKPLCVGQGAHAIQYDVGSHFGAVGHERFVGWGEEGDGLVSEPGQNDGFAKVLCVVGGGGWGRGVCYTRRSHRSVSSEWVVRVLRGLQPPLDSLELIILYPTVLLRRNNNPTCGAEILPVSPHYFSPLLARAIS